MSNYRGLSALVVAELYKARWRVELFFKWIKQHLRIYDTSDNAVRTHIWIVSVCVLVAIIRKRIQVHASLCTRLLILSITDLEKIPISQALSQYKPDVIPDDSEEQLGCYRSAGQ